MRSRVVGSLCEVSRSGRREGVAEKLRVWLEGRRLLPPARMDGGTVLPDVETSWLPPATAAVEGAVTALPTLRVPWVFWPPCCASLSWGPRAGGEYSAGSGCSHAIHEVERRWDVWAAWVGVVSDDVQTKCD